MKYPFRFYGRDPAHWAEGANMGHTYEVQFAKRPADAEKAALAKAWHAATATGVIDPGPWQWSDRFALVTLGERWTKDRTYLEGMAEVLSNLHGVVPIADVVYLNAQDEGEHDWDVWSLEQGAPSPGPAAEHQALCGAFRRGVDGSLPGYAADAQFDAAVEGADGTRELDLVAAALAAGVGPGKVGARPVTGKVDRPEPAPSVHRFTRPPKDGDKMPPGDYPMEDILARPVAWVKKEDSPYKIGLAWFSGDERREATIPGSVRLVALDESGELGLVVQRKVSYDETDGVWLLDLRDGTPTRFYQREAEDGYELCGAVFAAEGQYALLSSKRLQLYTGGNEPRQVARATIAKATRLHAAVGGKLLIVEQRGKLSVWGVGAAVLKRLALFDAPLGFAFEKAGKVYLAHGSALFELTDVAEALDALAPKPKKAARGSTKPKPALGADPVDLPESPLRVPPEVEQAFADPEMKKCHIVMSPSGRAAALCASKSGFGSCEIVRYLDDGGARVDVSDAAHEFCKAPYRNVGGISIAPGGRYLMIFIDAGSKWVLRLDMSTGAFEQVCEGTPAYTCGMAAAAEDDVLVLAATGLHRHRRKPDGKWEQTSDLKLTKASGLGNPGVVGGTLLAPVITGSSKPLILVSLAEEKLKKLGELTAPVQGVDWRGSDLFACDTQGRWWPVVGLGA